MSRRILSAAVLGRRREPRMKLWSAAGLTVAALILSSCTDSNSGAQAGDSEAADAEAADSEASDPEAADSEASDPEVGGSETAASPTAIEDPSSGSTIDPTERADERDDMVTDQIELRGVTDPAVLAAMRAVPRHLFVPDEFRGQAYDDHPLPIGHGQTISQPYIVGLMSEFLDVSPGDKVLEIGTGSGYQAAVLAEMDLEVYTIEIVSELADRSTEVLSEIGYQSVTTREGDGYFGWEEEGPFDAIIVTAAPDHVPQPLVQQLAPGGRMVIPIGPVGAFQTLWMFYADESGELVAESLGGVRFVPFTGAGAGG